MLHCVLSPVDTAVLVLSCPGNNSSDEAIQVQPFKELTGHWPILC